MNNTATVLIVDDIAANRETLHELLDTPDYRLIEAPDGATALRLAAETPPDLILLDMMMPGLDGFEVCRRIRASEQLAGVPVIIVTALDDHVSRVTGLEAGADDFIAKPFNRAELRARVRTTTRLNRYRRLVETQSALRETETRFRELAENIQDAFWIADPDEHRKLYLSPAYEKIWGRTCQSAYASPHAWIESIHPEDRERVRHAVETKQASGTYDEEFRIKRPDGTERWVRDRAFPVRDADGAVKRWVGVARDITHGKDAEAQVRASEERYRHLFNSLDEGFCVIEVLFDPAGQAVDYRFLQVNPTFEQQSGLVAAVGKTVRELIPTIEASWIQRFATVALTGEANRFVNEVHGLNRWFDIHAFRFGALDTNRVAVLFSDITARVRAEQTLQASESRYRALFELGPVAIYSCDAAGTIQSFNRRAEELWGGEPKPGETYERYCGSFKSFLPDGTFMPHAQCPMAQVVTGKVPGVKDAEIIIERRDGSRINAVVNIVPLKNDRGEITGAINCFYDITERKKAEATLLQERSLFTSLVSTSPDHIYFKDRQSRFVRINESQAQRFGLRNVAEAVGKTDFDMFGTDHARKAYADEQRIMQTGEPMIDVEEREVWPDGHVTWVSTTKMPWRDAAGTITGIVGNSRDITQRKAGETALRESEQWLRAVFEQAAVGVVQIDAATMRYARTNRRFSDITGYTREELKLLSPAEIVYPQDASVDLENFVRLRDGSITEFSREKRYVRKDGQLVWVSVAMSVIGAHGEAPNSFIAIVQDITERKQAQDQILRTQRLDNLGMLAAGIAHDFNNALAPIIMAGPLLRDNLRSDAKPRRSGDAAGSDLQALRNHEVNPGAQRLLNIVEQCAERGAGLVRQLLSFARGASGEHQLIEPRKVLKEVGDLAEVTFPKAIHVSVDLTDALWPIQANSTQIHQVILNLCVNARDAMPKGGELILTAANRTLDAAAAAEIADARPGNFLAIEVSDNGEGIPPDVLKRIWDPFFTTKGEGKGTGLGLSTVRGIVQQHDGFVTVRTRAGHGTRFTVFLPAATDVRNGEGRTEQAKAARGRDELILVVDDDDGVRTMADQILRHNGYRTITACDGAEAIAVFALRASEVQLLLTDLEMPILGGPALAKALRRIRPDLRIIAMSGAASRRSSATHKEFTSSYIAKPFQAETLLSLVRATLDAPAPAPAPAAAAAA